MNKPMPEAESCTGFLTLTNRHPGRFMAHTLQTLAASLGQTFSGTPDIPLDHVCSIESLNHGGVAFISNPSELKDLPTPAGIFDARQRNLTGVSTDIKAAIIVPLNLEAPGLNLIFADDPLQVHIEATRLLHPTPEQSGQIHPQAFVGRNVSLGNQVTIDPGAVVYDGVSIGDRTTIRAGSVIMPDTSIGNDCLIYPNVTIREQCRIGNRVIIHAGAVIGADGFGFYQRDSRNYKIPQIGRVLIGDDVEIGACTTIDRARFNETIIADGCKLDNLIHIAHNVQVGAHGLIAAQSGVAGSTIIGRHLMMGGQSGIRDNLRLGDRVTLFARTLVTSRTEDNATVAGMPSRPIKIWRQIQALINSLDSLFERVKRLEKRDS